MSECSADCVVDREGQHPEIRPKSAPKSLVWLYFNVKGAPPGEIEARRFQDCPCGCGNLMAEPPASISTHASLKARHG